MTLLEISVIALRQAECLAAGMNEQAEQLGYQLMAAVVEYGNPERAATVIDMVRKGLSHDS